MKRPPEYKIRQNFKKVKFSEPQTPPNISKLRNQVFPSGNKYEATGLAWKNVEDIRFRRPVASQRKNLGSVQKMVGKKEISGESSVYLGLDSESVCRSSQLLYDFERKNSKRCGFFFL